MLSSTLLSFSRRNRLAEVGLDLIREARGVLDTRPGFGSHMENELSAVGGREEVLTQERNNGECQQRHTGRKTRNKDLSQGNKLTKQR